MICILRVHRHIHMVPIDSDRNFLWITCWLIQNTKVVHTDNEWVSAYNMLPCLRIFER